MKPSQLTDDRRAIKIRKKEVSLVSAKDQSPLSLINIINAAWKKSKIIRVLIGVGYGYACSSCMEIVKRRSGKRLYGWE